MPFNWPSLCLVPLAPVRHLGCAITMNYGHGRFDSSLFRSRSRREETWIKYQVVMATLRHTFSLLSYNMGQYVASKSIFFYKVVMCPAVHPFVSYGCLLPIQSRAKKRGRLSHLLGKEEEEEEEERRRRDAKSSWSSLRDFSCWK